MDIIRLGRLLTCRAVSGRLQLPLVAMADGVAESRTRCVEMQAE